MLVRLEHEEQTEEQIRYGLAEPKSGQLLALRITNAVMYAVLILVNILSSQGAIGHGTNAQISAKYPTLITPAGWAFSIWGLIFALQVRGIFFFVMGLLGINTFFFTYQQGMFVVYGLWPTKDLHKLQFIWALNVFVSLAWLSEICWLFAFGYEVMWLSVVLISLGACACMFVAYLRISQPEISPQIFYWLVLYIQTGRWPEGATAKLVANCWYYAIFFLPTSINFGWLLIASMANLLIAFAYHEIEVPSSVGVLLLLIASGVALVVLVWRKDPLVALVAIWALAAIADRQQRVGPSDEAIIVCCWSCIAMLSAMIVGVLLVYAILHFRRKDVPNTNTTVHSTTAARYYY